jgi:Ca2+-binding RTX toxin-like protein
LPRTRTVVVDDDNSWTIREELTIDPSSPVPPEDDYIVVDTGFPVYSSAQSFYTQIVIWGVGLVSFGPVTAEQTAFMASLGATPDLSSFPGDFVAFGFSSTPLDHFQYGVKNGYVYVTSDVSPMISITPDGIGVFGTTTPDAYFGVDFGGFQATSTSAVNVFFSDLDVTRGTAGNNTMHGTNGPETLLGLDGNDHLIGNEGGDRLEGGAGRDLLEGNAGNDRLYGGGGADVLNGGDGNDRLFGGNGDDLLIPGGGLNDVDGGAGIDRLLLDFGASTSSLYFQFAPFIATPDGVVGVTNVEAVIVHGSDYSDVIIGTAYGDELYGENGFDLLQGGAGKDLLDGGAQSGAAVAIIPTAADTRETALPIDHFFTLNSDPDIVDSTTVPHATLNVHVQTDQFEFSQETNRYVAVNVSQAGAVLTVDVDGTFFEVDSKVAIYDTNGVLLASNDDGDYSGGFDAGSSNGADSLLSYTFAAAGTYYVEITSLIETPSHSSSFEVNFSLTSASVPTGDVLEGGTGGDIYVIHSSGDTVIEQAGAGTDTVRSDLSYVLANNVENLELTGSAAVDGTGNALANAITGNSAANVLSGLAGSDVLNGAAGIDTLDGGLGSDKLNGGLGNDLLTGGAGADKFVFDSALNGSTNVDQLIGFSAADDTIVLDRTIFAGIATGNLAAAGFFAGAAAHDASDRIIYNSANGNIYYDADGNGGGAQVLFAHVVPGTALTYADFLIVA